jgi:hypothetical protein
VGAVASQSTWLLFVVLLNSVIHVILTYHQDDQSNDEIKVGSLPG